MMRGTGRGALDRAPLDRPQPDRDPCLPCWLVAGVCGAVFVVFVWRVLA
jgi:hypothetical protein